MSGRTGYPPKPTPAQVDYLCDLLLAENASHDDIHKVRAWIDGPAPLRPSLQDVSVWIDQLNSHDPKVFGAAALEVCRKADSHHFRMLNRKAAA